MIETYRLVLGDGSEREIQVETISRGWRARFLSDRDHMVVAYSHKSPWAAITGRIYVEHLDVREVLAPGMKSRKELIEDFRDEL